MKTTMEPPVALVSTWINIMLSNEDEQVKNRAQTMLLDTFGYMQAVAIYAEKHNIKIKPGKS